MSSFSANFGENCCSISAQKTTRQIFFTICWQSENTDSDSALAALQCANELLVRVSLPFKNFCKVAQRRELPNEQKQQETIEIGFVYDQSYFGKLTKLTRYRSKQSSYRTFLYRTNTSRRADFIHSQHEIKEIFHPEKHTFSIKSEHKSR